jgi:plasmid stabilization system protein ParE
MSHGVVFSPEAEEQLAALYLFIAAASSPAIAAQYTEAIVSYCETLREFPHRGTKRDDVRPGLRITNYKKRTSSLWRLTPRRWQSSACSMVARITKPFWKTTPETIWRIEHLLS